MTAREQKLFRRALDTQSPDGRGAQGALPGAGPSLDRGSRATGTENVSHETNQQPMKKLNNKMKSKLTIIGLATASLTFAACTSTQYATYSGSPVLVGEGGASRMVQGLEVWVMGTPPRSYRVIGYIKDNHYEGNWKSSSVIPTSVATQARAAGADAVIISSDSHDAVGAFSYASLNGWGTGNNFFANGWGASRALYERNSTYLAIQYVNAAPSVKAGFIARKVTKN